MGLVCIAMVAVAGCGGGGDDSLTKAEFTQQADAICKSGSAKAEAAVNAGFEQMEKENGNAPVSSPAYRKLLMTKTLPVLKQIRSELTELGAPEADSDQAAAVVAAFSSAVDEIEDDPSGILKGEDVFASTRKLAGAYGLKVCAQSF